MNALQLHELHQSLSATFAGINGMEVVETYGDWLAEHAALMNTVAAIDLGFRSRICVTGADRARWLNGQVTNNVKDLKEGSGIYAALVSAKGKMQSDLNIYRLRDELLLDFEPAMTDAVTKRLEAYIIADDVQLVDVAPHYGLLSVQGPLAESAVKKLGLGVEPPALPMAVATWNDAMLGEIYLVNRARVGTQGFDLFVPNAALGTVFDKLVAAVKELGGSACGWRALETARIEAAVPRYGADIDDSNLASEAGIEARAISYSKGCYIGQEVIARIRTYGQVAKSLRGLKLANDIANLPARGDKLYFEGREVGYITSAVASPKFKVNIALGYVRKECNQAGIKLVLRTGGSLESEAEVVELPFKIK